MENIVPNANSSLSTGEERNIFGNIILFWEMMAFAELHKQDLAMLFLDFKKYYDRVD